MMAYMDDAPLQVSLSYVVAVPAISATCPKIYRRKLLLSII